MTDYITPAPVTMTMTYIKEIMGMLEDLDMLTDGYAWRGNTPVEIAQLHKCLKRVMKAASKEATADYRDTMESQVDEVTDVEPEAPVQVVKGKTRKVTDPKPFTAPVEPVVVPAPVVVQEKKEWDAEAYTEYFEEYNHLTCENYVMLINELLEVGDNSDEHLTAVEDLIEEAWSLHCGPDLNENLGRFEDILKARKAGQTLPPVVEPSTPAVELVSSDDQDDTDTTEEIDMSIFDGYTWWSDEKHNGKPESIFPYALNTDPNTCSLDEFVHGLLYARVVRDNGKEGSLKVAEIMDICTRRNFTGITWPRNGKGTILKAKASAILKPVIARLKEENDYTKKGLLDLTKTAYPTHAFYREEYLTKAVFKLDTPADSLVGDDLDEICENIDVDNLDFNIECQEPVQVEDEREALFEDEVDMDEVITTASKSALDIFNR